MKYKSILFATDFSDCANHAQAYAFAFALRSKAELHVVHAVDPAYPAYAGVYGFGMEVENHLAELKLQADNDLVAIARLACSAGINEVHANVLVGRPAEAIIDEARRVNSDLIVIGTHGRGPVDHFLFGSIAERVVRFADVPVLAIKRQEREFLNEVGQFSVKHVLCPCDLSPLAEQAAEFAADICRTFEAELTLLHVVDSRIQYPFVVPYSDVDPMAILRTRIEERLQKIAARIKGVRVHIEILTGAPHKVIVDAARDRSVDLITMTTHGVGGLSRALLGSTAEKIVRTAQTPIMTIRPITKHTSSSETAKREVNTAARG